MPQDSRIPSSKLGRAYDLNCKSIKLHKQPGEREILGCASSNFRFPCGTNCVELLKREQHTVSPCMHPHGIPYAQIPEIAIPPGWACGSAPTVSSTLSSQPLLVFSIHFHNGSTPGGVETLKVDRRAAYA